MAVTRRFLEVTYRDGRKVAAYFYLPRTAGDVSKRTGAFNDGLIVDFTSDGRAIGVEITAPSRFSLAALNAALAAVGESAAVADEVAPLITPDQSAVSST